MLNKHSPTRRIHPKNSQTPIFRSRNDALSIFAQRHRRHRTPIPNFITVLWPVRNIPALHFGAVPNAHAAIFGRAGKQPALGKREELRDGGAVLVEVGH